MAFTLDAQDKALRSSLLTSEPWLIHGFGTRLSDPWPAEATATLNQTHSDVVVAVNASCNGEQGEGDALVTSDGMLSIRTADCTPILLADPVQKVVASVHAGWRGTSKQIVQKAVERLQREYGSNPADMKAAIGPTIGLCCYEVSEDVAKQFGPAPEGKSHIDLAAINKAQLEAAGVRQIDVAGICTRCNAELCHSFRRDAEQSGRMHAVIGIYNPK